MKIHLVVGELFHADGLADGRTDGRTDGPNMTKLIITFRNFANDTKMDLKGLGCEIRLIWLRMETSGALLWAM